MIFPASGFLSEADEIRAGDMVMVAYLAPAHSGEEAVRVVRVGLSFVAGAMGFLKIDPVEPGMQGVPPRRFIGIKRGLRRDVVADESERVGLVAEDAG